MSESLPPGFDDLAPWIDWALPTMAERSARRGNSPIDTIQAFYDAMLPRMDAVLAYLADVPLDDPDRANVRLLDLANSLAEVAPAVELFFEPTISYGYDVARFEADLE